MRMSDIAKKLGLSAMTVSRALRQDSSIAPGTRAAVLQAIAEMGYVPNQIAGSLSSRKSGFVAALVPSLNNSHFSESVIGLTDVLATRNIQLLVGNSEYSRPREARLVREFLARKPEAMVLTCDGHAPETIAMLSRAKIPVIQMWDLPDAPIQHVVGFSNREAMGALVRLLIARGYRKPVYLGELDDQSTRGAARRQGYLDALAEHPHMTARMWSIGHPPATMSDGDKALEGILGAFPDADLVVCVSDPLAFGVICACQRRGLVVPRDIAVAGFGDFEIARVCVPSLTTVAISATQIGRTAAQIILEVLAQERGGLDKPIIRPVAAEPVLRHSAPGLEHAPI